MEIFDNSFKEGMSEDVMTAMTILGTARKEDKAAFMKNLDPNDKFAQQLKVADEEYAKAIAKKEQEKGGQAQSEENKVEAKPEEKKGEAAAQ